MHVQHVRACAMAVNDCPRRTITSRRLQQLTFTWGVASQCLIRFCILKGGVWLACVEREVALTLTGIREPF